MVVNTCRSLATSAPPVISRLASFCLILLLACINGVAGFDNTTNPIAVYKSVRQTSLTNHNSASRLC